MEILCHIQSAIDHTTTNEFDLSAEELRCFSQRYYHKDDAVAICLPDGSEKAFSYTTPSVTTHQRQTSPLRPPFRVLGMTVQRIFFNPSTPHPNYNCNEDKDKDKDKDKDGDCAMVNIEANDECSSSSVVSSVGSNDYYSALLGLDIEDDACSTANNDDMMILVQ